jgi:hypothetical protein
LNILQKNSPQEHLKAVIKKSKLGFNFQYLMEYRIGDPSDINSRNPVQAPAISIELLNNQFLSN